MQVRKFKFTCGNCFKPKGRRLANFSPLDDYECYAESYVKCFWNLCDHQKSNHEFITKSKDKVITKQPTCHEFLTQAAINDVVLTVK